jgi:hypothetical protein
MACRHCWLRARVPAKAQLLAKLTAASMATPGHLSGSAGANQPALHAPGVSPALCLRLCQAALHRALILCAIILPYVAGCDTLQVIVHIVRSSHVALCEATAGVPALHHAGCATNTRRQHVRIAGHSHNCRSEQRPGSTVCSKQLNRHSWHRQQQCSRWSQPKQYTGPDRLLGQDVWPAVVKPSPQQASCRPPGRLHWSRPGALRDAWQGPCRQCHSSLVQRQRKWQQ